MNYTVVIMDVEADTPQQAAEYVRDNAASLRYFQIIEPTTGFEHNVTLEPRRMK